VNVFDMIVSLPFYTVALTLKVTDYLHHIVTAKTFVVPAFNELSGFGIVEVGVVVADGFFRKIYGCLKMMDFGHLVFLLLSVSVLTV